MTRVDGAEYLYRTEDVARRCYGMKKGLAFALLCSGGRHGGASVCVSFVTSGMMQVTRPDATPTRTPTRVHHQLLPKQQYHLEGLALVPGNEWFVWPRSRRRATWDLDRPTSTYLAPSE